MMGRVSPLSYALIGSNVIDLIQSRISWYDVRQFAAILYKTVFCVYCK